MTLVACFVVRGFAVTALLLCAAAGATGCGSSAHTAATAARTTATASSAAVQQSICPSEQRAGVIADFGHFSSESAANGMVAHARSLGFQGLEVQRRGCNEFAVVLRGLRSGRQGRSLQAEARKVGLRVTLDCLSQPLQGGLAAVFGHRRTRRAAVRLAKAATRNGFQGLQVVQDRCDDWKVMLYGLKTAQEQRAFTREAQRAGYRVTFEPG